MKKSPQLEKLEEVLRSSKLVAGGFMGTDTRSVTEIIDADAASLAKLGYTPEQLAGRMKQITRTATRGLGTTVKINGKIQATVIEAKGFIVCPWPHPGNFHKRVTTVKLIESGRTCRWSDMNIHLIEKHGFFEGKARRTESTPNG
jgi:hypothetical protein